MVGAEAKLLHEDPVESSAESGSLKEAFKLAWRCWPYYRPQAKHLATFVIINSILGVLVLGAAFIGTDLIENKIILGEKLEPLQATCCCLMKTSLHLLALRTVNWGWSSARLCANESLSSQAL